VHVCVSVLVLALVRYRFLVFAAPSK